MFNGPDHKTAEEFLSAAIQKYVVSAPRLSAWLEDNLAEGFTVFDFPLEHRRSIRTTNSLERINKETSSGSGCLSERSFLSEIGFRITDGDQRRMADREMLLRWQVIRLLKN